MDSEFLTWDEWKLYLSSDKEIVKYIEKENEYIVWALLSGIVLRCNIDKDDETYISEFESDWKQYANYKEHIDRESKEGALQVSLNYGELSESPLWVSAKFIAEANKTTFFDFEIDELIKLISGNTFIKNIEDINIEDYMEISMIDKNDVLGMFSTYGLTVGEDVIELNKFVKKNYAWQSKFEFDNVYGAKFDLIQGLFVRFAYNNFGQNDINISTQLFGCVE